MRSYRRFLSAVLLTLATVGVGACAQIDEAVTGRELRCWETPYDLCARVADVATRTLPADPKISEVRVGERRCDADEVGDTHCWTIEFIFEGGTGVASVHQHADGTLGRHYTSIGAPPDT